MDDDRRPEDVPGDDQDRGTAPTLGNAVYRWADTMIKPLPFPIRVTIVGLIIVFLVLLPLVLFIMLLNRG